MQINFELYFYPRKKSIKFSVFVVNAGRTRQNQKLISMRLKCRCSHFEVYTRKIVLFDAARITSQIGVALFSEGNNELFLTSVASAYMTEMVYFYSILAGFEMYEEERQYNVYVGIKLF